MNLSKFAAMTVTSLVVVVGAGLGSAAHADGNRQVAVERSNGTAYIAGKLSFVSDGQGSPERELLFVEDANADGLSIVAKWKTAAKSGSCRNSGGSNTVKLCKVDLAENRAIQYQVCAQDYVNGAYKTINCSTWASDQT